MVQELAQRAVARSCHVFVELGDQLQRRGVFFLGLSAIGLLVGQKSPALGKMQQYPAHLMRSQRFVQPLGSQGIRIERE